ncbi:ABC transporter substrate-binding protein [Thiomicrorhabdus indica]|uniref:ABC transporter substrate-binding protein n=1 Tax=Thiomicrorhabdus indica TaxID=2267253 RepID=UPI00102DAE25|nr:ABC transporter substrate-binding protein [Thiomicrorhabdus indica]
MHLAWLIIAGLLLFQSSTQASESLENVTMQLRWQHQFQFAGYYAAQKKGFYHDQGLDVKILEGSPTRKPVNEVLAGRANYGEANTELLNHFLNGEPLVAMAAILQHSPSVLLTRKDSGIRTPQDLSGKRIMMMGSTEDLEFLSMFAHEGIDLQTLEIVSSSHDVNDLILGNIDAFNAYSTNEPFALMQQGIEPFLIEPLNYGIDFYSDILFTTQQELRENPERVKAFYTATIQGWEYALEHPEEVIDWLINDYGVTKSRAHLRFEAEKLTELILPKLIPIGNINSGRFQKMAEALERANFVEGPLDLNGFVYEPNPKIDSKLFWQTLLLAMTGLIAFMLLALWFWRNAQSLKNEIALREATEKTLKQSHEHFKSIIDNLQVVYYRADLEGLIVEASPSVEEFFHKPMQEIIGKKISDYYVYPFSREGFLSALDEANGKITNYEIQVYDALRNPHWISVNSQYVYEHGQVIGVEGTFEDITEQKKYEQMMQSIAFQDPLTSLGNRRALIGDLQKAIATAKRHGFQGAVLFVDLDNFKPVNDTYGHQVGDTLLIEVANTLKSHLRAEDSVYRIGGDEFILLLPHLAEIGDNKSENHALTVANKIIEALSTPFVLNEVVVQVSSSMGICYFPSNKQDADYVIRCADLAMYEAKRQGKNQWHLYKEGNFNLQ